MLRRTTLRQRLVLTLAAALSPILILGAVESFFNAQSAKESRRLELLAAGDEAVDDLEQSLFLAESMLEVFSPVVASGECKRIKADLQRTLPILTNVIHFDANGQSVCSSVSDIPHPITNMDWVEELRDGAQMIRTDAFYGPISETYFFSLLKRLEDEDGNFTGLVAFSMRADALVTLLKFNDFDPDIDIAISDRDGRLFGSVHFAQVPSEWFDELSDKKPPPLLVFRDASGVQRDITVTGVATEGVYVVVSRPAPGLLSEFTIAQISGFGLPMLAFTIALIAVWFSVDRLVLKWLTRLKRIAKIYGAGKYNLRTAHHFEPAPEEFAEFAEAMDQMAHKVDTRDTSLREALEKRDQAVKEIHHRVKNNLQIVTSFLRLQSRTVRDQSARSAIASAQHRINALSTVHETLYQNEQLDSVELKPFLEGLLEHLSNALGMEDSSVEMEWSLDNVVRKSDDSIPIALFIVEAITNSMKYAFDESGGKILIKLEKTDTTLELTIKDSSYASDWQSGSDALGQKGDGLGSKLMDAFARQLRAEFKAGSDADNGYCVELIIPHSAADEKPLDPHSFRQKEPPRF